MKPMCAYVALRGDHGYLVSAREGRVSVCLDCGYDPAAPSWLSRLWRFLTR